MASDPTVIRSVSIENFRGFRRAQTIQLAASAVIVSGSNGKGKTSFFDALQWLLLGSVGRLESLAGKRSGGYIVNRFAGPTASATVAAEVEIDGRTVVLTRNGDHKSTLLEWKEGDRSLSGPDAQEALSEALLGRRGLSLKDTVLTSGILQQDVVRAILEDEPKNRYRHMADLLGLQDIISFEDDAKRKADELDKVARTARNEHADAEQKHRVAETELARLEQRLATQPEITQVRAELKQEIRRTARSFAVADMPIQVVDAVGLSQVARRVRSTIDRLLVENADLNARESALVALDADRLASIGLEIQRLEAERSHARTIVDEAIRQRKQSNDLAAQLAELADRAFPLLSDRCPVCGQEIERGTVVTHLQELINAARGPAAASRTSAHEAELALSAAEARLLELQTERQNLDAALKASGELRADRLAWQLACEKLGSAEVPLRNEVRKAVLKGETNALAELRYSADSLAAIADKLAATLGAAGLGEEVERQRAVVSAALERLVELRELAANASQQAERAKTLAGAATRAIAQVTTDRFATLQPLVDQIFGRLAPHPAFTALGFEMGVAYRSGIADPYARDPESGVSGDPLLLFSSSQANVAALTYFLAMSWAGGAKALPFLLLDDPLQSMDDVNVLGFADLCRHIRGHRQLVVSTHENRLANLLERKLTPRSPEVRTRVVRFIGWDRDGPTIEQVDVEPAIAGFMLRAS